MIIDTKHIFNVMALICRPNFGRRIRIWREIGAHFWKKIRILTSENFSKFQKIDIFAFLCFLSEKSSSTSENLSPVEVFQVF